MGHGNDNHFTVPSPALLNVVYHTPQKRVNADQASLKLPNFPLV